MYRIKCFKIKVAGLHVMYDAWQINFLNDVKCLRTFLKLRSVEDLQGLKWNIIFTMNISKELFFYSIL
jgi:hypothetical protein